MSSLGDKNDGAISNLIIPSSSAALSAPMILINPGQGREEAKMVDWEISTRYYRDASPTERETKMVLLSLE